jgi:hypothetical protein
MTIHQKISQINLQPRTSAAEYQKLYQDIRGLAKAEDNGPNDDLLRGGEVWVKGTEGSEYLSLGFQRDEGYVGESLSVYRTSLDEEGKKTSIEGLRAAPTDKSERYLRFVHLSDHNADFNYDESATVLVDTKTQTLFREV